jgi:hypothetical protein
VVFSVPVFEVAFIACLRARWSGILSTCI